MTNTLPADVVELVDRRAALESLRMSVYWACRGPTPSIRETALGCASPYAVLAPGLVPPVHNLSHQTCVFRAALRLGIIDPLTGQEMAGSA
jgi:hypothetical protein